jgi:hypothetical protein
MSPTTDIPTGVLLSLRNNIWPGTQSTLRPNTDYHPAHYSETFPRPERRIGMGYVKSLLSLMSGSFRGGIADSAYPAELGTAIIKGINSNDVTTFSWRRQYAGANSTATTSTVVDYYGGFIAGRGPTYYAGVIRALRLLMLGAHNYQRGNISTPQLAEMWTRWQYLVDATVGMQGHDGPFTVEELTGLVNTSSVFLDHLLRTSHTLQHLMTTLETDPTYTLVTHCTPVDQTKNMTSTAQWAPDFLFQYKPTARQLVDPPVVADPAPVEVTPTPEPQPQTLDEELDAVPDVSQPDTLPVNLPSATQMTQDLTRHLQRETNREKRRASTLPVLGEEQEGEEFTAPDETEADPEEAAAQPEETEPVSERQVAPEVDVDKTEQANAAKQAIAETLKRMAQGTMTPAEARAAATQAIEEQVAQGLDERVARKAKRDLNTHINAIEQLAAEQAEADRIAAEQAEAERIAAEEKAQREQAMKQLASMVEGTSLQGDHVMRVFRTLTGGAAHSIAIIGPTGTGKTSIPLEWAAQMGMGAELIQMDGGTQSEDIFGGFMPDGKGGWLGTAGTVWRWANAVAAGAPTLLVIDEWPRGGRTITSAVMRFVSVHSGRSLKTQGLALPTSYTDDDIFRIIEHPTTRERIVLPAYQSPVVLTGNIGDNYDQGGADTSDQAVRRRLTWLHLDNYSQQEAANIIAKNLADANGNGPKVDGVLITSMLEAFVKVDELMAQNQRLMGTLNLPYLINWGRTFLSYQRMMPAGEAYFEAARDVWLDALCPVDAAGHLDKDIKRDLTNIVLVGVGKFA